MLKTLIRIDTSRQTAGVWLLLSQIIIDISLLRKAKKCEVFFQEIQAATWSQKIDQQDPPEIKERGAWYFVFALQMGFESNLNWYCPILEENTSKTVSTGLTNARLQKV